MASAGEYDAFLETLKKQRALLDEAIAAIEAVRNSGVQLKGNSPTNGAESSHRKKNKLYAGLTFIDSVVKILSDSGRPMTTGEIMDALDEGGFTSDSQNKRNTYSTMLHKYSKNDNARVEPAGRATWRIAK